MKKIISLIIAAAMLLALGVTAFAAEEEQEPVVRVAIPVEVTVNQTGNAAPERHTFYYDLHYDYAVAFDSSDSSSQQSLKVSFGGALEGDENGFSVTVNGKGTASGTIIFEGTESVLSNIGELFPKERRLLRTAGPMMKPNMSSMFLKNTKRATSTVYHTI